MSVQDLDEAIGRAIPVFVVGDLQPDDITLKLLDRYSLWPNKINGNIYIGYTDNEVIDFISRNIESGGVYALDDDDWLRQAGFTHHLTVNDPLHGEDAAQFYVVLEGGRS